MGFFLYQIPWQQGFRQHCLERGEFMGSLMQLVVILSFFAVVIAFAFAVYLYLWVKKRPPENKRIYEVSLLVQAGAKTL